MKQRSRIWIYSTCLVVFGCATSPPEHYYTLAPAGGADKVESGTSGPKVSIAAVTVPQLIDRSEMVFQSDEGRVVISEQNRWAEPLRLEIGRVLAADLSSRLGGSVVLAYPEQILGNPAVQVKLDIQQWQVSRSNGVRLVAIWEVAHLATPSSAQRDVKQGRTIIDVPVSSGDVGAALAAQNQALSQLSDAIAVAIRALGAT